MKWFCFILLMESMNLNFDFENSPKKFVDVETGEQINLYAESCRKIIN